MEEYEFITQDEFHKLIRKFYAKRTSMFKQYNTTSSCIYEDSMIKVFSGQRYSSIGTSFPYRVDRKKFTYSDDYMLRKYPNIVFSLGPYPLYNEIVRYSKEAGYIVPHLKKLIYDYKYFQEEQVMFILES